MIMPSEDSESAALGRRYLIKRPKVLQYFHDGALKKASEGERQAGRFELFLDLLYVALVCRYTLAKGTGSLESDHGRLRTWRRILQSMQTGMAW
jgi:hypothetical protein